MSRNVFIDMAHHPQVILDTMRQIESEMEGVQEKVSRTKRVRRMGCGWAFALLALGAFLFVLDSILGYGRLFAALGAALAAVAVVMIIVGIVAGARASGALGRFPSQEPQFAAARQILQTLRDDTGRKGRVVGWLDLTGPQQREKQVRTGRTRSGKPKVYYRDPWFQVKIKLVDGNLLRLAFIDKVKTKSGYQVGHYTQVKAKLVVNPALYRWNPIPAGTLPLFGANISEVDGALSLAADVKPGNLPVREVLGTLKTIYRNLEPIGSGPTMGSQSAGVEV
jgi:hypothetical protein